MYKNRYIIRGLKLVSLIWVMLLIALSCSNNDELNTDILASKQTTIKAFGPNPALRGQSLSVVGTHLDKISKVILVYFSSGTTFCDIRSDYGFISSKNYV